MKKILILMVALSALASANPTYLVVPDQRPEMTGKIASELIDAFQGAADTALAEATPVEKPAPVAAKQPTGGRNLTVHASAYCLRGRTASGTYTQPGTIAVDPRVIPLGTKVFVPGYGWARARDTGGYILGNRIDLWFPSSSECYNWGVRQVTITVYD